MRKSVASVLILNSIVLPLFTLIGGLLDPASAKPSRRASIELLGFAALSISQSDSGAPGCSFSQIIGFKRAGLHELCECRRLGDVVAAATRSSITYAHLIGNRVFTVIS